jgi:hypothetical protein
LASASASGLASASALAEAQVVATVAEDTSCRSRSPSR